MAERSATSMLRLLHARDVPLDRSLAVARQLQVALDSSDGRRTEADSETELLACLRKAPPFVRAHYQRMLLDWTVLTLSRASSQPASLEEATTKRRKLNSGGNAQASQAEHHGLGSLQRLWVLLEALLSIAGSALGSTAHPSLAETAARTCQLARTYMQEKASRKGPQHHAAVTVQADVQELDIELPSAVLGSMELLQKGQYLQSFSSSARFAEAALQAAAACAETGLQTKSTDAWCKVAAHAVSQLSAACKSQADHKKTFKTIVTRLLVPILQMNPRREGSTASWRALVSMARQLLDAVLFSNEHVLHVQALALGSLHLMSHDSQKEDLAPAADADTADVGGKSAWRVSRQSKYAALLPEAISSELKERDHGNLPDLLAGLPWLLVRFKAALKRTQPVEPAKASKRGADQTGAAALADFAMFALLLQLLVDPIVASSQATAAVLPSSEISSASHVRQCMLADGIAELLQIAATQGTYKQTQDREGLQRNTLKRAGNAIFRWCLRPPSPPEPPVPEPSDGLILVAEEEAAASRAALSAARVLEVLMNMEHRAVQPALDELWTVIWKCALLHQGIAPAVGVATSLLKAYGELRQLVPLLESLAAALGSPKCPVSASTVISDPRFQEHLCKAAQEAPPGQRAALVGFVAASVRKVSQPRMTGPALAALMLLLNGILISVRVDVTTASAVAKAVEELVSNSLGKPLRRALSAGEVDAVADSKSTRETAALLQLYGTALALHAACAAMQPQVPPLLGQAIIMDPHAEESASPGYFDALLAGREGCLLRSMNSVAASYATQFQGLLLGEDQEGLATLWQALAICQTQRLDVLHERLLHLEYCCPAVPTDQNLPASQPIAASSAAAVAGESQSDASAAGASDDEGEEAEEASPRATLNQRTREELSQVANGLTGLCMLNDMAKHRIPRDGTAPDVLVGIGTMVKHYHSLILRYASLPVIQNFLTSLISGAAMQQRMESSNMGRRPLGSSETRSRAAAVPCTRGEAEADGLSFSAAALELLEGQEFWETAELADSWPQAMAGKLHAVSSTIVQSWLQLSADGSTSPRSPSQAQRPRAVSSPARSHLAGTKEQLESCLHLLQQMSEGSLGGMQSFEPANQLHSEALEYAKQAAGALLECGAPQSNVSTGAADLGSTRMTDGLAAAEGLSRLLCSIPLQWLERHNFEAWHLLNTSLVVQSLLLRLSMAFSEHSNHCAGMPQASRTQAALMSASAAIHCFIARVLACGNSTLRALMEQPCRHSGLNWPYQVASILQRCLVPPHASCSIPSDPPLSSSLLQSAQRLSEASAAIMHHTSRHLFLNLGHPKAGARSMSMLGKWMGDMPALAFCTEAWLHHEEQLEAACAALRSAAAAMSIEPEGRAAQQHPLGPRIGEGPFAPPHLRQHITQLASMLKLRLSRLSMNWRNERAGARLQVPLACLLSATASLLESAKLLKQPHSSNSSAVADHEEAAHLILALPSYLSLACDMLQSHRPAEADGKGQARDWRLLQKPVRLLRAAASMLQHGPEGTWLRLAALHLHCLRQLSPHLVDPVPRRQLSVSLGIVLPVSLGAPSSKGSGHAAAFHHSLLLSVQELAQAAGEKDLQEMFASVPQLLSGYSNQPGAACALLQVTLLLVESAHSGPAMRMLNRHAQLLATALMNHLLTHEHHDPPGSAAAAQCLALRCMEALAVRDSVVKMSGQLVGAILHLPYELLTTTRSPTRSAGVFAACCHVLLGMVRHRTAAVRRCMALLAASARALLQDLLGWQAPRHADVARQCAEHLSHLYEDIAERKEVLGMYCHFILADYVTLAAAPVGAEGPGATLMSSREQQAPRLLPEAAAALKPGACALYGACSPAQVQHVYTVLQKSGGGTRQAAMTALRHSYESTVKFSGKI